jgi:TRAP transporter TAXI family solute receptor
MGLLMKTNFMNKIIKVFIIYLFSCIFTLQAEEVYQGLSSKDQMFILSTGSSNGIYYAIGNFVCDYIVKKMNGHCIDKPSRGSVQNMARLGAGDANIVFSQLDVVYNTFIDYPVLSGRIAEPKEVRLILKLYPETFNVVVRKNSDINDIKDLDAKKINLDSEQSGSYLTATMFLSNISWNSDYSDNFKTKDDIRESIDQLCANKIDGFITVSGHINPMLKQAFNKCDLKFVPVGSRSFNFLLKKYKYYQPAKIPQFVYQKQQTSDWVDTFGVYSVLATMEGVPDYMVYDFLMVFFKSLNDLQQAYPDLIFAFEYPTGKKDKLTGIPYHPGALKYFKEYGLMK